MRNQITLPAFNGVAAGQTATLNVPLGPTYHNIMLAFYCTNAGNGNKANWESYASKVRVKLNSKTQREFTGAELDSINAFYNRPNQAEGTSFFPMIYFSEPWERRVQDEDTLAWGTQQGGGVQSFSLEVDLAAGITGPTLSALAEVEYVSRSIGLISKWYRQNVQVSAAGQVNLQLPRPAGDAYRALHCFPVATTDIISTQIETDKLQRQNLTDAQMRVAAINHGWTPQTNMSHYVFDVTGRVNDALPMSYQGANGKPTGQVVQDFGVTFNMNAANSFQMTMERLGAPD